jgi:hypothetical protein
MVFFHPCLLTAVNAHIGKARNPWGEAGGGRRGARPWLDLGRRRVSSCSPVPLRFASLVLKEIVHPSWGSGSTQGLHCRPEGHSMQIFPGSAGRGGQMGCRRSAALGEARLARDDGLRISCDSLAASWRQSRGTCEENALQFSQAHLARQRSLSQHPSLMMLRTETCVDEKCFCGPLSLLCNLEESLVRLRGGGIGGRGGSIPYPRGGPGDYGLGTWQV